MINAANAAPIEAARRSEFKRTRGCRYGRQRRATFHKCVVAVVVAESERVTVLVGKGVHSVGRSVVDDHVVFDEENLGPDDDLSHVVMIA